MKLCYSDFKQSHELVEALKSDPEFIDEVASAVAESVYLDHNRQSSFIGTRVVATVAALHDIYLNEDESGHIMDSAECASAVIDAGNADDLRCAV